MSHDWKSKFPLENIRDQQRTAIDFVLEAFDTKKYAILEAPTGSGKSIIGITVGRYLQDHYSFTDANYDKGSYVLTTQKMLQEQYTKDFSPPKGELVSLKSASNFDCGFHKDRTCADSRKALNLMGQLAFKTKWFKECMNNCPYLQCKKDFMEGYEGVTNYSYFLTATSGKNSKFKKRNLLICDESHTVADEVCKFISVDFTKNFAENYLKLKVPKFKTDTQIFEWISTEYKKSLQLYHAELQEALFNSLELSEEIDAKVSKRFDTVDKHLSKLHSLITNYNNERWLVTNADGKMSFKPLDASLYTDKTLFRFGEKCLLMSATILDKEIYCNELGLNQDDVSFLSLESTFPKENRKILYYPLGKMSANSLATTMPKMSSGVDEIMDSHKEEKGIIHCANFSVGKAIYEASKCKDRLLLQNEANKEQILKKHFSKESTNTVLISPSMCEGIDLKDDLSRFQIIVKLPFPYLGDKYVKAKFERQPKWYQYVTLRSFVQSTGRSVRHEKDWATTYVLDECFSYFYKMNKSYFPKYISECLENV